MTMQGTMRVRTKAVTVMKSCMAEVPFGCGAGCLFSADRLNIVFILREFYGAVAGCGESFAAWGGTRPGELR